MPAVTSDKTIPQLRFRLPLDPARLLRARQRIRDYLYASGVLPAAIEPIVISLEEAMTNAVRHSGAEHDVEIGLRLDGRDLIAEVRDCGRGFDIATFDPAHTPDPTAPGGRGLYLMGRLMDDLQLRCDGGLEVRVLKRDVLPAEEKPQRPRPRVSMPGDEGYLDQRHQALLDEVDERVASLDWEYRYVFVNKAMLEAMQRPETEVLGRTVWELFPGIIGTPLEVALRAAMELGRSSVLEHQSLVTAEWLESRVYPTASGISTFARAIAERKRKESERDELFAALSQSQDRLQAALETARMAYWDWDAATDRTITSPSASDVFGLAPGEALDSSAVRLRLVHPDDLERYGALVRSAGERGDGWHSEFRIIRPADGRVAWLEEWATAEPDPGTGETHLRGLVWDITERKRAEEAAQAKDAQWRHLARYAPAGIYEIDFRGPRFVTVNDFMCTYSGYSRDELLAKNPFDLLDEDSQARFKERIRKTLAGEKVDTTVDYGFVTKQGEKRWTVLNVTPSYEDGKPVGAFVVGYDVTDRRRAEDALRESESLLRAVTDNSPNAIYAKDAESRWVMANPAVLRIVGRTADEALGKTDRELYDDPEIGEAILANDRRIMETGEAEVFEEAADTPQGRRMFMSVKAPRRDASGSIVGVVGISHDVTQLKQAHETLRRQQYRVESDLDAMRRLQALGTRFVREGSHEALLDEIVETGVSIADADCGTCQLLDAETGRLSIAAHRNLPRWWLDYWDTVEEGQGACGTAMLHAERVIVEDVAESPVFVGTPGLDVQLKAGIRAVISTPLLSRSGELLGMVSQHFKEPHLPDNHTLGLLDLLARQAVEIIERARTEAALRDSEARFRMALRNAPVSVSVQDRDLRFVWAYNQRIASPEDVIGKTDADLFHPEEAQRLALIKRRVLDEDVQLAEQMWLDRPRGRVFLSVTFEPIHDENGQVVGVGTATVDLTPLKRAEEALREAAHLGEALTAIDALVHSSLDTDKAVQAALSEGAAALGASAAVVTTHQASAFRIDYQFGGPAGQIGRLIPDELDTPGLLALARGETVVIEDAATDPRMSRVIAEEYEIRSLLVTPLLRERDTSGCLYFVFRDRPHVCTQAEIDFVHRLGTSLSLALENAALYAAQRDIAVTLQEAFMHTLPALDGLELGMAGLTASQPALVGGDFWDLYALPDGKIMVVIGDVAGKGVQATALTETVHSTMRAFATVDDSPGFILRKTNELLLADEAVVSFVTALVLVLDPATGQTKIASAGHPGPIHLGKDACVTIDPAYRSPLGAFPTEYPTTEAVLRRGDYFVLHTDGVTEARHDGELFGEERTRATLSALRGRSAQALADGLAGAASSFGDTLKDDLEVLVIRRD
ncbi:MAG TPA: PAS domain S-box protein [Thermoleophilia bacterium]|nr:PAS domain S-box protein [Thermoleophilia bacterium]